MFKVFNGCLKNVKLTKNGEDISKEIIIKSIKSSVINGTT